MNIIGWLRENAGRVWKHNKSGGEYIELGRGEIQISTRELIEGDTLIAYLNLETGKLWFRREDEFEDGRFTEQRDGEGLPLPMSLPDDLFSHREDFRRAIVEIKDVCGEAGYMDEGERGADLMYWTHQLDVWDRISDFLDHLDVERVEMPKTDDLSKAEAIDALTEGNVERVISGKELPSFITQGAKKIGFGARVLRVASMSEESVEAIRNMATRGGVLAVVKDAPIPVHAVGEEIATTPLSVERAQAIRQRLIDGQGIGDERVAEALGDLLRLLKRAGEALEASGFADCYRAGYDAAVTKRIKDDAKAYVS